MSRKQEKARNKARSTDRRLLLIEKVEVGFFSMLPLVVLILDVCLHCSRCPSDYDWLALEDVMQVSKLCCTTVGLCCSFFQVKRSRQNDRVVVI